MSRSDTGSLPERKTASTRFGDIAYLETGSGPPAVFIHAVAVQNYVAGMDNSVTVAIRDDLTRLLTPTPIVWGAAGTFFDVAWAPWLATTIPGTVGCVEIPQGRLFHPFERPEVVNQQLTQLWVTGGVTDGSSH